MKWKLTLLIAIVIGAVAGPWIKDLPGFVIIAYEKTSYEMRLWVAVAFVLICVALVILALMIVRYFLRGASKAKGWQRGMKGRKAKKKTIKGMLAYSEGRWKAAEQAMVSSAKNSEIQLINYLVAAQSAQQQNAEDRRDAYLRLAYQAEPDASVAIGLTQAQLQLKNEQFEQALASLSELKAKNPSHPYVLKLLCQLFERLQDWSQLIALLPQLKKHQVYSEAHLASIEAKAICGQLDNLASADDFEKLKDFWLKLPSAMRKPKAHQLAYAKYLLDFQQVDEAEALLKPLIKKDCDAEVLALYGNAISQTPSKQLGFLESWQEANPNAPREVYLTLGKLAYYSELWGKARQFLEKALQIKPSGEAYLFMARTLQHLDEEGQAARSFQLGLEFMASPKSHMELVALPKGSDDLIKAGLLPKFQKAGD